MTTAVTEVRPVVAPPAKKARAFRKALHPDGGIESNLVLLGISTTVLFLTLVTTLFLVQRGLAKAQEQVATQALPTQQALALLGAAVGDVFERQSKVALALSLPQLATLRDRAAIESKLRDNTRLVVDRFAAPALRSIVDRLPEHGRAFLQADQELFQSVEHRLQSRAAFEEQLSRVELDLAELIQSANALAGIRRFEHVLVLRRLAQQMSAGAPSSELVRAEVLGGTERRTGDVSDLVQAVIGFARLVNKIGVTTTEDALNSGIANELVQNRSRIEDLLAALARGSAPGSDAEHRIGDLTARFQAISPRVAEEAREDALVRLRRHILAEFTRSIAVQLECAKSARLLTGDLAVLGQASNQQADDAVRSSTQTTRYARLVSLSVSLFGLMVCAALGFRIRASVRVLRATNHELSDLRDNLELKVAGRTSELSASREQYRLLVETTKTVPFELAAKDLAFSYMGPQAEALLGVARTACLEGGFLEEHLHPDDRTRAVALLAGAFDGKSSHIDFELRLRHTNGTFVWVRLIASIAVPAATPVPDGYDALFTSMLRRRTGNAESRSGKTLRGVLLDVTETRHLEGQLRQAQKLESVGRLASGVAHEINTPVQFVSDNVHFIKEAFGDLAGVIAKYQSLRTAVADGTASIEMADEMAQLEGDADVAYILESAPPALDRSIEGLTRIADIVRSMKEFAHPDQKEMSATDLNHALGSTLTMARNEYKYVAEIATDFGDIPPVICHAGEMNQVFLNIIVNAAHAIGDVVKGTSERGRISIATRREGEDVIVAISDSGGGIPEAILDRIFDPFFTTKDVGKGTGQGLAIARNVVVDKHNGQISVQSQLGAGTTFSIRLPIAGSRGPSPQVAGTLPTGRPIVNVVP